jgi:hypothetical protein
MYVSPVLSHLCCRLSTVSECTEFSTPPPQNVKDANLPQQSKCHAEAILPIESSPEPLVYQMRRLTKIWTTTNRSINVREFDGQSLTITGAAFSISLSLLLMDHLADCRSELPTTKGGGGFEDKYEYQPEEQGGAGDDSDSSHHDRPLTTISVLQKGMFLAARSQMVLGLRVTSLVSRLLSLRKAWQTWI